MVFFVMVKRMVLEYFFQELERNGEGLIRIMRHFVRNVFAAKASRPKHDRCIKGLTKNKVL